MHRLRALLVVVVVVSFGAPEASRADDPLAALRQASGCGDWYRLHALTFRGRHRANGLAGNFRETLDVRNGRYVRASTEGPFTTAEGFDGAAAWSSDVSGASHPLDAPSVRARIRSAAWLASRGWCTSRNGGASISVDRPRVEGAKAFDVVTALPPGGVPVRMWIDRQSNLLDRIEERLNESDLIERYDDWRAVANTVVPFTIVNEDPQDHDIERFDLENVEAHVEPATAIFRRPALPHDVAMLHGARVTRVPYVLEGQKPIVGVWLNGRGPFPFVLDTGGHFILAPATARRIGISGRGAVASTGSGAQILESGFARVRTVRIGDAEISNDVARIVPYGFGRLERGARPPKAGWLGLSLFERFAVTMDPVSRTIALRPLAGSRPQPRGERTAITFDEDAPLVACAVDGRRGPCMIDTGNAGATIVEGYWAQRSGLAPSLSRGLAAGDGVTVGRAGVAFGRIRSPHEVIEYEPQTARGSESTTVVAAILSEGLIDRYVTTIDYARGALWMQPVPRATPRPFNRSGIEADKKPDGSFTIWYVIAGSPAQHAGLRAGMTILAVDGISARTLGATDLSDLSVAPIGTVRDYRVLDGRRVRTIRLRLRELLR